jgi:hypothetical protein
MMGVAIAVAVLFAGKPAPGGALKGCEIYGPAFGLERFIHCKNFQIDVYPPIPVATERAVLTEQARAYASVANEREVLTNADVKIAGKPRTAFRYIKKKAGGASEVGLVTTIPAGPGAIRLVHCWRGMETGCYDVLGQLTRGIPETTQPAPGPLAIAGRALTSPKGCTRKGPAHLVCGATELAWVPLYPGAPETLEAVDPMLRRATAHLGTLETNERYCELEKGDALCRVATVALKEGGKLNIVHGFIQVRDARLWVSCSTRAEVKDALPSPCDQVMVFKPPQ